MKRLRKLAVRMLLVCSILSASFVALPSIAYAANYDSVVNTFERVFKRSSVINNDWKYSYTGNYTYKSISWKNGYYLLRSVHVSTRYPTSLTLADLYRNEWKTY